MNASMLNEITEVFLFAVPNIFKPSISNKRLVP
jgi:hypothetical protein